jgi:hypothetical protein
MHVLQQNNCQFLKINLLLCCSRGGAGDCSSCVGVMLELARGVSQWAHGFKSGVLFLFNTGEEEGLDGAHSFITQVTTFIHHNKPCCITDVWLMSLSLYSIM